MSFKGYSDLWHFVESKPSFFDFLKTKEDDDVVVFENEFCEDYEEKLRKDQRALNELLYSEATMQTADAKINPVLAIYDKLLDDAEQINTLQNNFETFRKKNSSNTPIVLLIVIYEGVQFLSFRTKRRNEVVQVDIPLRKIQLQFYDNKDKDIRSDEYCLEIYVNKKLANPEKLQQEFSVFLASGKHLIELIFDTIWPHIDACVKKDEQKIQRKVEKLRNRETLQKENNPRYLLRSRKNEPSTAG